MRRRDREITDKSKIADVLMRGQAMSLAFAGDPYVIPMNYGFTFDGGEFRLYIHGATEGQKVDRMLSDPRVAFTVFTDNRVYGKGEEASQYTSSFDCVCGEGVATLLQGEDKAAEIVVTKISGKHHD